MKLSSSHLPLSIFVAAGGLTGAFLSVVRLRELPVACRWRRTLLVGAPWLRRREAGRSVGEVNGAQNVGRGDSRARDVHRECRAPGCAHSIPPVTPIFPGIFDISRRRWLIMVLYQGKGWPDAAQHFHSLRCLLPARLPTLHREHFTGVLERWRGGRGELAHVLLGSILFHVQVSKLWVGTIGRPVC